MLDERWDHEEDRQKEGADTPYEPFWVLWRRPKSDDEFVEQLRKDQLRLQKWKPYLLMLHFAILAVLIGLSNWLFRLIVGRLVAGNAPANAGLIQMILLVSIGVGTGMGIRISHSVWIIFDILRTDRRTDLLLKYHDLAQQLTDHHEPSGTDSHHNTLP